MHKNLLVSIAILTSFVSITEAKECEQHVIGGSVHFINATLPIAGCSSVLTVVSTIVAGKGCFTASNATISIIPNPSGCSDCPSNTKQTFFSFDVTFCKPFKSRPSITVGLQNNGNQFTVPFHLVNGQPALQINAQGQPYCDDTTLFTIRVISTVNGAQYITNKGFTWVSSDTYVACPGIAPAPTGDDFCELILFLAASLINAPGNPYNISAEFHAVGT